MSVENIKTDKELKGAYLTGERPLFHGKKLHIEQTIFNDGESPLKESRDIVLENSSFQWKYPLWYSKNIEARDCTWLEMARSGVWYTDHIRIEDTLIEAPKNFRRCHDVTLDNVYLANAAETFWNCEGIKLAHVQARGDYFGMNSTNITIDDFKLVGNYAFDGAKNMEVHNARMLSKDDFWNSENVTVYDSVIHGEYLGWNSKNLTFINCTIESLQGLCYIENLKMINCTLLNTTLAFEYSKGINAQINGRIKSVMNPSEGRIQADEIETLILDPEKIDPAETEIICPTVGEKLDKAPEA